MSNLSKYKMSVRIRLCLYIVIAIVFFLFRYSSISEIVSIICVIIVIVDFISWVVTMFLWCKCPHCGKHLHYQGVLGVEFCPYCGASVEEDE